MGKLKGFRGGKADSLVKRAAQALIFLVNQKGSEKQFISWLELYSELTGIPQEKVDPDEMLALRKNGSRVKELLRDAGHGWAFHPADRSLIRACKHGEDSAINCMGYYRRRATGAATRYVLWADKTVGDSRKLARTKENGAALDAHLSSLPKFRAAMMTLGAIDAAAEKAAA